MKKYLFAFLMAVIAMFSTEAQTSDALRIDGSVRKLFTIINRPAAFHNFYAKNWVFRLYPLTAHLPYTSLMDAVVKLHEKRPALPEKLN